MNNIIDNFLFDMSIKYSEIASKTTREWAETEMKKIGEPKNDEDARMIVQVWADILYSTNKINWELYSEWSIKYGTFSPECSFEAMNLVANVTQNVINGKK